MFLLNAVTTKRDPMKLPTFAEFCEQMQNVKIDTDPKYLITPQQYEAMSDEQQAEWLAHAPDGSPVKVAMQMVAQMKQNSAPDEEN